MRRRDGERPAPASRSAHGLPGRFWAWAGTASLSVLGVQVVGFAMGWAATGHGPLLAGLVLTASVVPRTLLLLVGGTMADRSGVWRILLAGNGAMLLASLVLALLALRWGAPPALLLATALVIGTIDAFYLPAAGALPRLLLRPDHLARGLALRQTGQQLAATLAGPLAGAIYGAAGLPGAALLNAATFAVLLALLLHLRRRHPEPAAPDVGTSPWADLREGIVVVTTDPLLRAALLLVAAGAAFVLPLTPLLLPLLGRDAGWGPQFTGLAAGTVGAATGLVAIVVLSRGAARRPGIAAAVGLALAGLGAATLGATSGHAVGAIGGCAVLGLGTGLFATHMAPLVLGSAPRALVARVQALAALAQSLPLIAANLGIGAAAHAVGPAPVLIATGSMLVLTAVVAATSTTLSNATLPAAPPRQEAAAAA
ncbi:MFS transporter [Oerskovia flava]|uniref:MFS transporter n=1 Tax=Oerskovia flava TaxID=2986422 RepID=UPI0022405584|nr:MFS transporter [Oerskovia sp. JB1-3-2]